MNRTYYIYILRNPNNKEIFYVGATLNPALRLRAHCIYPHQLYKLAKDTKYHYKICGREKYILEREINPEMEVVDKIEVFTKNKPAHFPHEALKLEQSWIDKLLSQGHPLKNKNPVKPRPVKFSIGEIITL